jgi:prepilin-type processing-associated H-X9-DG protein
LIELLVVMAIIGILAGLVIAAVGSARTSAQQAKCIGNVRQIGVAILLYSDTEGKGYAPRSSGPSLNKGIGVPDWCDWVYQLKEGGYIANYEIYKCNSDSVTREKDIRDRTVWLSYGINEALANPHAAALYTKLHDVARPTRTALVADSIVPVIGGQNSSSFRARVTNANGPVNFTPGGATDTNLKRHRGGSVVCFVDGHTQVIDQNTTMNGHSKGLFYYSPDSNW